MAEDTYRCPLCEATTRVKKTLPNRNWIERRRECENGHKTVTFEAAEDAGLLVERRTGEVVPLDRRWKIEHSINHAGAGTLQDSAVAGLTHDVLRKLGVTPGTPVSTEAIGDAVLQELALRAPSAAMRYAATFLTSRGRVTDSTELVGWMIDNIPAVRNRRAVYDRTDGQDRPEYVVKLGRSNGTRNDGEGFSIQKLFRGIRTTTAGVVPATWRSTYTERDAHEFFVGAICAWVLSELSGQRAVTSGQISGAVLRALRSECPLGYLRFASIAKKLTGIETFLDEARDLELFPSPKIGLDAYTAAGQSITNEVREIERPSRRIGDSDDN